MSLNPSHHLFLHFLNVIGNMSKHLAAKMIGTVSGLRGKSGECCSSSLYLRAATKHCLGADFFLPNYSAHTKKIKRAEADISARNTETSLEMPCHLFG